MFPPVDWLVDGVLGELQANCSWGEEGEGDARGRIEGGSMKGVPRVTCSFFTVAATGDLILS